MAKQYSQLQIDFEGYWQCRQATDPDPSDDPRGTSGYTYAVGAENDLDMVIRLQADEIKKEDFRYRDLPHFPKSILQIRAGMSSMQELKHSIQNPRELSKEEHKLFGIFVTGTKLDGKAFRRGTTELKGGKVRWLPHGKHMQENGYCEGPKYELRNEIIYHQRDGIIMPIVPFHIQIHEPEDSKSTTKILIERSDPLNIHNPKQEIWEMPLKTYRRRNPQIFHSVSSEVMECLGFDSTQDPVPQFDAFFQKRKQWLELELSMAETDLERSALENRLFGLKFFSENRRLESRLGLQASWDFSLRGDDGLVQGLDRLGLKLEKDKDWPIHFWMGGFDGDVMRGYMKGNLKLPVMKAK